MSRDLMDDRRCHAKSKRSGEQCKRHPVPGLSVCSIHGGKSPQAREAAERRLKERGAEAMLRSVWEIDAAAVTDPIDALQRLSGQLQHTVNVLGARLDVDSLDSVTAMAWTKTMRELRQALADMARLGIAERHVEIEQERAQLVTAAFRAALLVLADRVTLLPADRDLVIRTFLEQLGRPAAASSAPVWESPRGVLEAVDE